LNLQHNTWNSLSQLTVNGVIDNASSTPRLTNLTKVGLGELVLTAVNTYLGPNTGEATAQTFIHEGWVTIENSQALGATVPGLSPTVQPGVSVADGASLVFKQDFNGNNLNVAYNMRLAGTGITHRSPWLNQKGALLNLQGDNLATGDIILSPVLHVTFQGALANQPLPAMTAAITTNPPGGSGRIWVRTATPGGANTNAVQTLSFEGHIPDGTFFTLTVSNGVKAQTTAPIAFDVNVANLILNIQAALNGIAVVGPANSKVSQADQVAIGAELDGAAAPVPYSQLTLRGQVSDHISDQITAS